MSDPVENVEIEDVLSSIRRLVSTDERDEKATQRTARPEGAARAAAAEATQEPAAQDRAEPKLVLTPALRVDGSAPEPQGTEGKAEADDAPHNEESAADDARAELEEDEDRAFGWDDIEDAEFVDMTEAEDAQDAQDEAKLPQFLRHPDASKDTVEDPAEDTGLEDLQSRIEQFSAAMDEADEPYDPEPGSEDANAAEDPASPLPWAEMDAAEAEANPAEETAKAGDAGDVETTGDTEGGSTPDLSDDLSDEDAPDLAENWPEREASAARAPSDWLDDDAVIDEDMLRDMVAEIVRQELQGALGERITRNVRKLVRREINRALMSQGID